MPNNQSALPSNNTAPAIQSCGPVEPPVRGNSACGVIEAGVSATVVVVSGFDPALLEAQAAPLRRLARTVPLAIAGPGATEKLAKRLGALRLDGDLVAAAEEIARSGG